MLELNDDVDGMEILPPKSEKEKSISCLVVTKVLF